MHMLAFSQKQKMGMFLIILTLGFVVLALFTSSRLNGMSQQYQRSSEVSQGSVSILQLQSDILTLASEIKSMSNSDVTSAKQSLEHITTSVVTDTAFLHDVGLEDSAQQLSDSVVQYQQAVSPWLALKSELGFSVEEGKLGELKSLASIIEKKITETGMVTINSDFQAMIKAQQNYLLQPSENNLKLFNRAMGTFVNMSNSYAMLDLYQKEVDQFKKTFLRVNELSEQVKQAERVLLATEVKMKDVVSGVGEQLKSMSQTFRETANADANQTVWSVLLACGILALFSIATFTLIGMTQARSLNQTTQIMKSVSTGDLAQRVPVGNNHNDEFTQLAQTINTSCENLGALVHEVQESSQALSTNASELNLGLDRLAVNQSDVLGQTQLLASATEEVSVTTQEVSNSLEFVAEVSRASTQAAEEGAQIIGSAIQSIEDIGRILESASQHIGQLEEASSKIDTVMDIINGIAEQTNLLALNAAIEAARAGEQGRGFAVVADEVRSLAVRTVDAVEDISGTIEKMKRESAEVIQYIGQSEQSMAKGRERGHSAMQAMSQITEKADDAAQRTEVIFDSIKELATTSQSMADNMTQISAAMQELEENNGQLKAISEWVNQRSISLSQDCQKFTV